MAPWLPAALASGCCIAVHYLFLRAASGRIGDTLGALVLEATAAVGIGFGFLFGVRGAPLPTTKLGIAFAVASGLAISVGSILLFGALRKGGPVASTGTIVLGGGVTLSALAAPFIFGEGFTLRRGIGVALGIAAIAILSGEGSAP